MKKIILMSAMSLFLAGGSAFAEQAQSVGSQMTTAEKCAAIKAGATSDNHALVELCAWVGQYR